MQFKRIRNNKAILTYQDAEGERKYTVGLSITYNAAIEDNNNNNNDLLEKDSGTKD